MVGIPRFLQQTAVCLGLLLLAHGGATASWAEQCGSCGRLGGCACTPNAANFGYFPPQWRVWPGEARPDKDFPHSIGAEVIRTPRRAPLQERPQPDASAPFIEEIEETVPEEGARGPLPPDVLPRAEAPPVAVDPAAQFAPSGGSMGVDEPLPMFPETNFPPAEQPAESDLPPMPARPKPLEPTPAESSQSSVEIRLPGLSAPSRSNVPFPPRPDSSLLTRSSGGLPFGADTPLLARPNMSGPARVDVLPTVDPYRQADFSGPVAASTAPAGIVTNVPPTSMPFDLEATRTWHDSPRTGEPLASDPAGHSWASRPFTPLPSSRGQALSGPPLEGGGVPPQGGFGMALPQPWSQPRDWRQSDRTAVGAANANQQAIYHDSPQWAPESELTLPTGPGIGFPRRPARQAAYQHPAQPAVEPSFGNSSASQAGFVSNGGGTPPALGGYCPVELVETQLWASGDARWAWIHQGRTYRMSGQAQLERFVANPDRYAPVLAGTDPVLALDQNTTAAGRTEFCVDYDGRLYTFSSAATMARFHRNPVRYAGFVAQAAR